MSLFLLIVMIVNLGLGFWLANRLGMGPGSPLKLLLGARAKKDADSEPAEEPATDSEEAQKAA